MADTDRKKQKQTLGKGIKVLSLIWLLGALVDRLWFALDRSVPAWDPADYLTGVLNYWQALQQPDWFSASWWEGFWQLSSKVPPLTYIATVPWLNLFGIGPEQSTLVNLFFSAILLASVYGLAWQLFADEGDSPKEGAGLSDRVNLSGISRTVRTRQMGWWAAGLCLLMPGLYRIRLNFLTDYPLVALVTLCFYCLTAWRNTGKMEDGEKLKVRSKKLKVRSKKLKVRSKKLKVRSKKLKVGSKKLKVRSKKLKVKSKNSRYLLRRCYPFLGYRRLYKTQNSKLKTQNLNAWLWAAAFGVAFGLALLVKQTALFFLLVPLCWLGVGVLRSRAWGRLLQLLGALLLAVAVCKPWYCTNWLFVLTAGKRATLDSAIAEGDPALTSLKAWLYYWRLLPEQLSWPLLVVPCVALLLYWIYQQIEQDKLSQWRQTLTGFLLHGIYQQNLHPNRPRHSKLKTQNSKPKTQNSHRWLAVFLLGAYLLCSLNINKDSRYVLPYLPAIAIWLAWGLHHWPGRWGRPVRWATLGLAVLLMGLNLFPLGGSVGQQLTRHLSPEAQHYAKLGPEWPHPQVMATIVETTPYLRTTLGILPSTPEINQHNLNYYGALENFQVYGRQVGTRPDQVEQDARSLSWFITKTGDQGSLRSDSKRKAQAAIVQTVEQGHTFRLQREWPLPDGSWLRLYHRQQPPVVVKASVAVPPRHIQLDRVTLPERVPPGMPVPITYKWSGSWEQLHAGLVLLTWQKLSSTLHPENAIPAQVMSPRINRSGQRDRWFHDRAIGQGELQLPKHRRKSNASTRRQSRQTDDNAICQTDPAQCTFQVIERTAMLPPASVAAGTYTLQATYLNPRTGETNAIATSPPITLEIDPNTAPQPAPELDLVTQLRALALALPNGADALGPVFEEIGRINQYDPVQGYARQAQQILAHRLQQDPNNLEFAYNLVLTAILQRDADGAIAALKPVIQLDPQNPHTRAYLAFVQLYTLQPKAAQATLQPALELAPERPEIQALSALAALMQGNPIQTINHLKILRQQLSNPT